MMFLFLLAIHQAEMIWIGSLLFLFIRTYKNEAPGIITTQLYNFFRLQNLENLICRRKTMTK